MNDNKQFKFNLFDEDFEKKELEDNNYTAKINIPQYEMKGLKPKIYDLVNINKYFYLKQEIENSNVSEEEKRFLIYAATRHLQFNYSLIAEYYAHATPEMQELMEKSALVIIDFEDAIKNGYAVLLEKFKDIEQKDIEYNEE